MKMRTEKNMGKAFTVPELLIALTLTALVLVGLAAIFNASAISYVQNESMYNTMNSARQALHRITRQLRTALVVHDSIDHQCVLITQNGNITFRFDSSENAIFLDDAAGSHLLCENIIAATFTKSLTDDGLNVKSVRIAITISDGTTQRQLVAAAAIRRIPQ